MSFQDKKEVGHSRLKPARSTSSERGERRKYSAYAFGVNIITFVRGILFRLPQNINKFCIYSEG